MATTMRNPLYVHPHDQYEREMIDFEARVEAYLCEPRGTMRRLRLTSSLTESGARARREWQRMASEFRDAEAAAAVHGRSLDDDTLPVTTIAIVTVAGIALWLVLAVLYTHGAQWAAAAWKAVGF